MTSKQNRIELKIRQITDEVFVQGKQRNGISTSNQPGQKTVINNNGELVNLKSSYVSFIVYFVYLYAYQ